MLKNEILEMSRKENKVVDEMERQIKAKSHTVGYVVGFLFALVFVLIDMLILDTGLIGRTASLIYMTMLFTSYLVRGVLHKNKFEIMVGILGEVSMSINAVAFVLEQI